MVNKYRLGKPFDTEAVVEKMDALPFEDIPFEKETKDNFTSISFDLGKEDIIFGLGETVRGINKRGWIYESWCSDETTHSEDKRSLYGAHNFIVVRGKVTFG